MKITATTLKQIIREQLLLESDELSALVGEGQDILQQIAAIRPDMLEDVMDIWSDYIRQLTGETSPFLREETKPCK